MRSMDDISYIAILEENAATTAHAMQADGHRFYSEGLFWIGTIHTLARTKKQMIH
jgi:hypothetical protein